MGVKLSVTLGEKKGVKKMKKVYIVYKLSDSGILRVDKIFSKLSSARKYASDQRLKGGFYHCEEMKVEE